MSSVVIEPAKRVKIILPKLHEKQQILFNPKKEKFSIICCGTKFGKTMALAVKAVNLIFARNGVQVLWAAPYYANAKVGWKYVLSLIHPDFRTQRSSSLSVTLKHNNSTIFFKGVNHDPEEVEGEAYHHVIIDEASKVKQEAVVSIRTTTTATRASLDIVSTPRGKNWFYDFYKQGQDPLYTDYISYRYPTAANPYIDPKEIEIARRQLTERLYRQYYLAEFVDESELFVGYVNCIYGERLRFTSKDRQFWYADKLDDRRVVIGVDWAKSQDYTVFIAIDYELAKPQVVAFMRFQGLKYTDAIKYLSLYAKKFKEVSSIYHDKTGVGEAIDDMLSSTGLPYEGITFTNKSKSEMVNNLLIGVEQQMIQLPYWEEMINEIEAYELTINHIGTMRFEAAKGKHDDIISALMLAWAATTDYSSQDLEVRSLENIKDEDLSVKVFDEQELNDEIAQFEALNNVGNYD